MTNQKKAHAVFLVAVSEPLTDYTANADSPHKDRSTDYTTAQTINSGTKVLSSTAMSSANDETRS